MQGAFGVDVGVSKACSKYVQLDLTTDEGRELLFTWLRSPRVIGVFMAPPCGTASQARKAGMEVLLRCVPRDGLMGLPGLSQVDEFRVQQANLTYQLVADVVRWCLKHQRIFAVENPLNSLFWQTSFWQSVSQSVTM